MGFTIRCLLLGLFEGSQKQETLREIKRIMNSLCRYKRAVKIFYKSRGYFNRMINEGIKLSYLPILPSCTMLEILNC